MTALSTSGPLARGPVPGLDFHGRSLLTVRWLRSVTLLAKEE